MMSVILVQYSAWRAREKIYDVDKREVEPKEAKCRVKMVREGRLIAGERRGM